MQKPSNPPKNSPALTIDQMIQGIQAVKENATELLRESNYLFDAKMYARAYALSYLASEELSKTFIFLEACGKLAVGMPLNWGSSWLEITDHLAKATQFFLNDLALEEIKDSRVSRANLSKVLSREMYYNAKAKATSATAERMGAFYCNLDDTGVFRRPSENISEHAARDMIEFAKARLTEAREFFKEQSKAKFLESLVTFYRMQVESSLRIAELYTKYIAQTISPTELNELTELVGVSTDLLEQSVPDVPRLQLRLLRALADPQ